MDSRDPSRGAVRLSLWPGLLFSPTKIGYSAKLISLFRPESKIFLQSETGNHGINATGRMLSDQAVPEEKQYNSTGVNS